MKMGLATGIALFLGPIWVGSAMMEIMPEWTAGPIVATMIVSGAAGLIVVAKALNDFL